MGLEELAGGRFAIEQQIATGGMGAVFRARDQVSGEVVAVKVLADGSEHRAERFVREIVVLSGLSHPGIVRYVAHGATPSGELFLVMEWLDGEDLKARLDREALTMRDAVMLATRVAEALGAAHARGIVHRDLKPSNLFLPGGRIEQVKVLDFGIAQQEGRPRLTHTGVTIGTPGYMAPEQARNSREIDPRADVFALGCVLFQCLTGTAAFDGADAAGILGKILFEEAPRVSALWPDVPEDLDALVAQMLAKEPAQRPSDGANLAAALAALGPRARTATVPPMEHKVSSVALTVSERRFLSVVLMGRAPVADEVAGEAAGEAADEVLRQVIEPYGGRLEPLADGSTIVVLEADNQVATDQAARAARCALALRAHTKHRPMALAMGRADSVKRLPEGDVIGRVARLVSHMAKPPDELPMIVLDEVFAGLLDARFDVVESEAGLLLRGERALMQGARTLLGRPTSCVGRDWELGALAGILDACIEESEARVVVVTAPAGMGKSRLGAEFIGRVQQRGGEVAVWVGRGDSLRAGATLDLLTQALRGALGISGGEPLAERWDKVRTRVSEHVPASEQKRVTEFLAELIGAPFPADDEGGAMLRAARHDAQFMGEQMRKAWMDFLQAETSVHPVLFVLEDLHWGDFGTVQFIDAALRERGARPWMVLALARPEVYEVFPNLWANRQKVQEIRLKVLGRKAGERLVRQVLGDRVGPETMERLVQQAEGNAFYLEELIRAVAEGKAKAMPETVLAMAEARLGRLSVEARRVLRAASVFGEVCWESAVIVLLGGAMGSTMVGEWLTRLMEQEVLAVRPDSRFSGERELTFRHALLREGAYAMLTDEDKRLGHRLAGEWLEQHGEGDPMVLGGHFERGGQGTRAASYYLHASEQAFHVLDLNATVFRAGLGLGCAPSPEVRIALLGMRCEAHFQGWQVSVAMPEAEEVIRSALPGSIPWAQGMGMYLEGTVLTGRIEDFSAAIELLRAVTPASEAMGKMAVAFIIGTNTLDLVGRLREGTALEERFTAVVHATEDCEPLARFWWNLTIGMRAAYAYDDPWKGLEHCNAIQAIFDVIGGERVYLNMHLFGGMNLVYLGAFEAAARALEGIVAADLVLGVVSALRRFHLAWLYADRGELDKARALATELSAHGQAQHNPLEEFRGRWVLAEVLRRMGDHEGAERELQVALGMVSPIDHPAVLGTLSVLRLAQGRAEEALAVAEDAVSRCAAMGGCGMFRGAFVRLAHAEALHATGAHDAARHVIAEARMRLLATADRIADPAHKTSFLENVPENARTLMLARAWSVGPDR